MTTFEHAQQLGAGAVLRDPTTGVRFRISDWSPSTRHVFGHQLLRDGQPLEYRELPAALVPDA